MRLRNKKTGQEGNFIINKDHFECVDLDCVPSYFSLSELLNEWEDYGPKEPLIKDEKIRKAIRAWAEVVGEKTFIVSYNMEHHDCCIYTGNLSDTATIDFGTDLNLKEGRYTIDELCGEEE